MSITRVKPSGWSTNEKLSSGDMSSVDANASFGLDKRSGQTDTLASTVTVTGAINFTNNVVATGSVTFGSLGSANFGGAVNFGSSSVSTFAGPCTHNGAFTAASLTNLNGLTTVNGVTSFTSTVSGSGSWNLTGSVSMVDPQIATTVNYQSPKTFNRVLGTLEFGDKWSIASPGVLSDVNAALLSGQATANIVIDDVPDGATLNFVTVYFRPSPGHSGVPVAVPSFDVYRINVHTGSSVNIGGAAVGTPANVASYESLLSLTGAVTTTAVSRTAYKYVIVFSSEGGVNATTGLTLRGGLVNFTASSMDAF